MKKAIITIITIILITQPIHALDWHEQKSIAKEIGRKLDYDGSFRFAYYEECPKYLWIDEDTPCDASYTYNKDKSLVTFYKTSLRLSKTGFTWLVLHELGHYHEDLAIYKKSYPKRLNESYADNYAYEHLEAFT